MTRLENNTVYQFVISNVGVEIFLKKRKHQKKGALKQEVETSMYTFFFLLSIVILKKIQFTLFTCFSKNITKWCKVYTKTDSWFQKS